MDSTSNLQRARLLLGFHRPAEAEREAREGLRSDPCNAQLLRLLCKALHGQKKLKEAHAVGQQLLTSAPNWAAAHITVFEIELARNRYGPAEVAAREALRLAPESVMAHLAVGACHAGQRRWPAAMEEAKAALALEPENVKAQTFQALVLSHAGRGDEAMESIQKALRLAPDESRTHLAAGLTHLQQNQPAPAIQHYIEALRLDPMNKQAQGGLQMALLSRNFVFRYGLLAVFWMFRQSKVLRWVIAAGMVVLVTLAGATALMLFKKVTWLSALKGFGRVTWLLLILFRRKNEFLDILMLFDKEARESMSKKRRGDAMMLLAILTTISALVTAFVIYFTFINP